MGEIKFFPSREEMIIRLEERYDVDDVIAILDLDPKILYDLLFEYIVESIDKFDDVLNSIDDGEYE